MIVLGIDPGSTSTGYGLLRFEEGRIIHIASGAIRPSRCLSFPVRLKAVYDGVMEVIGGAPVEAVAVEDVYQGANARTAARLGHVRGVILLAAAHASLPVAEYPPNEIKSAVTGNGLASKEQVSYMVRRILDLGDVMATLDESDAVAVAICHCHRTGTGAVR